MPCPRCSSHAVNELCGHCRQDLEPAAGNAIRGMMFAAVFSIPLWAGIIAGLVAVARMVR